MTPQGNKAPDVRRISQRGQELFKALAQKLTERHRGQFVAIEVESEDYFLGKTEIEANKKARQQHPGKVFYLGRLGYAAAFRR